MLWVYMIARPFGYWPFQIEFNEKYKTGNVRVTFIDMLWLAMLILIYSATAWYYFAVGRDENASYTLIEILMNELTILFCMEPILSSILDLSNRRIIWKIIVTFYEFDEQVRYK